MVTEARWREAQATEPNFWASTALYLPGLLQVLADNAAKACHLSNLLKEWPYRCLEVGIGPFGVGVIGFLPEIAIRIGLDPANPIRLDRNASLHDCIQTWRDPVRYVVAAGENIPIASNSMDLVVCCNVIDHAFDPNKVLSEIHRILRPNGLFFFDVDTFSVLGLVKWHSWTKLRFSEQTLVRAHTYRMFEPLVRKSLRTHGFEELVRSGHNFLTLLIGHARPSTFLARKTDSSVTT
jgi:ubiquinone/menaquinone biosynthesis C-methylase UbiE